MLAGFPESAPVAIPARGRFSYPRTGWDQAPTVAVRKARPDVLTLITGPVRSGKSRFAEVRAARARGPVTYLATAAPHHDDAEWGESLARNLAHRPPEWQTIETADLDDAKIEALIRRAPARSTLVIDSLGGWLATRMQRIHSDDAATGIIKLDLVADRLADACIASRARLIVVGDEIGWGAGPELAQTRIHREVLGRLQQRLARSAREMFLIVAGYALDVKAHGQPVAPLIRRSVT